MQRVARELTIALDRELANRKSTETWKIITPTGVAPPELDVIDVEQIHGNGNVLWEQTALYTACKNGILLNFANTGPIRHKQSIVMIHDAQVRDAPKSYSLAFRAWYRLHQPILASRSLRVLTVSNYSKSRLLYHGIAQKDQITVVPNGADHILRTIEGEPKRREAENIDDSPISDRCVAFASPASHKNLKLLLKTFADPKLSNTRLELIGGDLPEGVAVPSNVIRLGRVSDEKIRQLFTNAICLLLPSKTEGFGLPAIEAMGYGLPVIAANAGALPETCGDAAILLDPDDATAWSQAIEKLRLDKSLRKKYSTLGLQRVHAFPWAHSASLVLDTLEDCKSRN